MIGNRSDSMKLHFANGKEIETSSDHEFLVLDPGSFGTALPKWVSAQNLKVGYYLDYYGEILSVSDPVLEQSDPC